MISVKPSRARRSVIAIQCRGRRGDQGDFRLFCPICFLLSATLPGEESMRFAGTKIIHAILAILFVHIEQ